MHVFQVIANGEGLINNLRTIYNLPASRTDEAVATRSPPRRSEYEDDLRTSRRHYGEADHRREPGSYPGNYPEPESYYSSSRGRGSVDRDYHPVDDRHTNSEYRDGSDRSRYKNFDITNNSYATKQSRHHPY